MISTRKSNIVARLFGEIGRLVLDDDISDNKLRARIFNVTTREDLEEMVERAERIARPKDECHLDFLLNRYSYTRQYTPQILAAFDFQAAHPEDPLTGRIYRKHWEFCTLFRAREALRRANLWVEHSICWEERGNPAKYLCLPMAANRDSLHH